MKNLYQFSVCLIAGIMASMSVNAQTFIKNYIPAIGSSTHNFFYEIISTTDGGYLAAGRVAEPGLADQDVIIVKFDANGNVIWSKTQGYVGTRQEPHGLIEANGNYYVMSWTNNTGVDFNEILIMKLDNSGNMLAGWPKQYQATSSSTHKFCYEVIKVGNNLVFAGHATTNAFDNLLFAIDLNGNLIWENTYNIVGTDKGGYGITQLDNGNLATAGSIYSSDYDAQLMMTDSTGNFLSLFRYDAGSADLRTGSVVDLGTSNGILMVGNYKSGTYWDIYSSLVDYSGVEQWTKTYGLSGSDDFATSAKLLSDGTVAIVGYVENPNSSNSSKCAAVIRINPTTGGIVTQYGYEPSNTSNQSYRFFNIDEPNPGKIVLAGDGVSPGSGQSGYLLAATPVTGLGAQACGYVSLALSVTSISVTTTSPSVTTGAGFSIGNVSDALTPQTVTIDNHCGNFKGIEDEEESNLSVYPNPTSNILNISTTVTSDWEVFVLNMLGERIFYKKVETTSNIQIDVADLISGTYVVELHSNKEVYHKKFVKN